MSNRNKILAIVGLVIVIVGFFYFSGQKKNIVQYEVIKGNVVEATYGVGTVKADKVFNLKIAVNSKMLKRYVHLGQNVKKGDQLLLLDSFPIYRAPFDGTITALNYEEGELVFSSSTVLTLVNESSLYLEISLDEKSINKLKVGNIAKVSFENQKKVAEGKVRAIFSNEGQFYVHIDFDQNQLVLLPGMTADVSIISKEYDGATLVPIEAIEGEDQVELPNKSLKKLNILYRNNQYAVVDNLEVGMKIFSPSTKAIKKKNNSKTH